jgi:RHS repeat-associated protein
MRDEVARVTAAETGYRVSDAGEYTGAGVWKKLYLSLNGHKFLEYANGTTYFFHADHLGTPRVQSNLAGAVVETWRAYPYGEQWQLTGGAGATHRYTGKERDSESANDYFGARYYWSGAGRWLAVDTVLGNTAYPQRLNRFAFNLGDPINHVDPNGANPVIVGYSQVCTSPQTVIVPGPDLDGDGRPNPLIQTVINCYVTEIYGIGLIEGASSHPGYTNGMAAAQAAAQKAAGYQASDWNSALSKMKTASDNLKKKLEKPSQTCSSLLQSLGFTAQQVTGAGTAAANGKYF